MRTHNALPITFAEWGYLGQRQGFQRRDFRYDNLTNHRPSSARGRFLPTLEKHEIFKPAKNLSAYDRGRIVRHWHRRSSHGPTKPASPCAPQPRCADVHRELSNDEVFTPPEFATGC